jgi:hypothetical protein
MRGWEAQLLGSQFQQFLQSYHCPINSVLLDQELPTLLDSVRLHANMDTAQLALATTAMGKKKTLPKATGVKGYPANGDANYAGLCDFACNYGYCPKTACSTTQRAAYIPTSSPFTPPACTSGEGEGKMAGLCSFACNFGFCPVDSCTCLSTEPLNVPPEPDSIQGVPDTDDGDEYLLMKGLCNFACSRDHCPAGACKLSSGSDDDSDDDSDIVQVIIDSSIWDDPNPAVSCGEECVLVLPPYTLPSPSTVTFDEGYETTFNVAWETPVVTTLPDGEVKTTNSITHILQTTTIKVPHSKSQGPILLFAFLMNRN